MIHITRFLEMSMVISIGRREKSFLTPDATNKGYGERQFKLTRILDEKSDFCLNLLRVLRHILPEFASYIQPIINNLMNNLLFEFKIHPKVIQK